MSRQLLERRGARRAESEQPESEVLIEEVRRRARRRRLLTTAMVVLLAGVGGGIYLVTSRSSGPSSAGTSTPGAPRAGLSSTGQVKPDEPIDLAISRNGDLYIADRGRDDILEWKPSGGFRVIAGTGVAGLAGDDRPGDRAEVNYPNNLVIAPDGTLYFAQTGRIYPPVNSSSTQTSSTAVREITPSGKIQTIAGLDPHCASASVRSIPANSAFIDGAFPSLSSTGALVLDANVCVGNDQISGPNMVLTSSGTFVKASENTIPAVASIDCAPGVAGTGFQVFACSSGGGDGPYGHGPEILVVRSNGSSVAYPDNDNQSGGFAAGDGKVVGTYDGNVVQVTANGLVPLATSAELRSDLHLHSAALQDIAGLTVGAHGGVYFVASVVSLRHDGCQSRILERVSGGAVHQIWSSSFSRQNACF